MPSQPNGYKNFADKLSVPLFVYQDDCILYINPVAVNLLGGLSADDFIGQSPRLLVEESNLKFLSQSTLTQPLKKTFLRLDGTAVPVEMQPSHIHYNDRAAVQVMFRELSGLMDKGHTENSDITEQARVKQEFQQAREQLDTVLQAISDRIYVIAPSGHVIYANEAAARAAGYASAEEMIQHPANAIAARSEMYDEAGQPIATEQLPGRMALQGKKPALQTIRYLFPETGESSWVIMKANPVFNAQGELQFSVVVSQDITRQKIMEQELRDSEMRFKSVINAAPVIVFAFNQQGIFTFSRGKGLEALKFTPDGVVGKSVFEIYADYPQVIRDCQRSLAGETLTVFSEVAGVVFDTRYNPLKNEQGEVTGVIGVAIDVTRQQQVAEALNESVIRAHALLDAIPDMMFRISKAGVILDYHAENQILYSQDQEILGKNIQALLPPDVHRTTAKNLDVTLATGNMQIYEYQQEVPGLGWRDYEARMVVSGYNEVLVIVRDITEQKKLEQKLIQELNVTAAVAALYKPLIASSSLDDIISAVLEQALQLTTSEHGYVSTIDPVTRSNIGHTLTEMLPGECQVTEEYQLIAFPIGENGLYNGLWGHALNTRKGFYINQDIEKHPAHQGTVPGHISIKRFLSVPVMLGNELVGQIALANAEMDYSNHHLEAIKRLAEIYALGIQRIRAEKALRFSEQRYRTVINVLAEGIVVHNPDGTIHTCNTSAERIRGLTADQMMGRTSVAPLWHTIHEDGSPFPGETHPAMITLHTGKAQSNVIMGVYKPDGSLSWIQINTEPFFDEQGSTLQGVVASFVDITEIKQKELALRESEEKFRQIAENINAVLFYRDPLTEKILYVNPAYERFWGQSVDSLYQDSYAFMKPIHPDDREQVLKALQREHDHEEPFNMEYRIIRSNGEVHWMWARTFHVRDEKRNFYRYIGLVEDIGERKKIEESLKMARDAAEAANHAKSLFLANMSHELRTPMNAILGFSRLISRNTRLPVDVRESLEIIIRSGDHLLALINDILDMSSIEAGQVILNPVSFDLYQMLKNLEDLFRIQAESKNLSFSIQRIGDLPQFIQADEQKLRQILINLINNALKFTHQGSVRVKVTYENDALDFEIADTGRGIDKDMLAKLFQAFARSVDSRSGTGLGLAISQEFVRLMGGELTVSSKPGQGTVFRFAIQVKRVSKDSIQVEVPTRQVIALAAPGQPAYRILVADDRQEVRVLMEKILRPVGLDVRSATNGKEAIDIFKAWEPHLIFMDMRMPIMDGYTATRQIRDLSEGESVAIIGFTASVFKYQKQSILLAGCDNVLYKPIHIEAVFDILSRYLNVEFLYEEPDSPSDIMPMKEEDIIPRLAAIDENIIKQLKKTVIELNIPDTLIVIQQIRKQDEILADELEHIVNALRFDRLSHLIHQVIL